MAFLDAFKNAKKKKGKKKGKKGGKNIPFDAIEALDKMKEK